MDNKIYIKVVVALHSYITSYNEYRQLDRIGRMDRVERHNHTHYIMEYTR